MQHVVVTASPAFHPADTLEPFSPKMLCACNQCQATQSAANAASVTASTSASQLAVAAASAATAALNAALSVGEHLLSSQRHIKSQAFQRHADFKASIISLSEVVEEVMYEIMICFQFCSSDLLSTRLILCCAKPRTACSGHDVQAYCSVRYSELMELVGHRQRQQRLSS